MECGFKIEFHMLFDDELHETLMEHAEEKDMSLSEFINMVLRKTLFFIDKADFANGILETDWDYNEDDLTITVDRKVFLDRDLKYKLYHFQDHFKFWSKASVVRYILRRYLWGVERVGEVHVDRVVARFRNLWERKLENSRKWNKFFSEAFLKKTHMTKFFERNRVEVVNNYGVITEILLL